MGCTNKITEVKGKRDGGYLFLWLSLCLASPYKDHVPLWNTEASVGNSLITSLGSHNCSLFFPIGVVWSTYSNLGLFSVKEVDCRKKEEGYPSTNFIIQWKKIECKQRKMYMIDDDQCCEWNEMLNELISTGTGKGVSILKGVQGRYEWHLNKDLKELKKHLWKYRESNSPGRRKSIHKNPNKSILGVSIKQILFWIMRNSWRICSRKSYELTCFSN